MASKPEDRIEILFNLLRRGSNVTTCDPGEWLACNLCDTLCVQFLLRLSLSADLITLVTTNGAIIEGKITEPKTRTLACVQVVELSGYSSPILLKLYDRRFATQLRKNYRAQAWTREVESLHRDLVHSGQQTALWKQWQAEEDGKADSQDENEDDGTIKSTESFLQFRCHQDYQTECHAYELMSDLQGVEVPKIHGTVTVATSDASNKYLNIPGILMQYIKGSSLDNLATTMHRQYWQATCDRAIQIIHHVQDRGICNTDTNVRCFIVQGHKIVEGVPEIFMVDFGQCLFRDRFESEEDFRRKQADADEEGAIGVIMQRKLKDDYKYRPSLTAMRLSFDFMLQEDDPDQPTWEEFLSREQEYYA
ncbi:hypothetical protein AMS68_004311 [Peltaster fructicola]|uniref:Protein kinase domain-containing protein n=1 Tax=Peltaster fructicola TaxID=286661 RepID=A0A6H0XVP0_9PEZI|nr:hypothetical protein AMS68_004311 [Peltaster fructicola]